MHHTIKKNHKRINNFPQRKISFRLVFITHLIEELWKRNILTGFQIEQLLLPFLIGACEKILKVGNSNYSVFSLKLCLLSLSYNK